MAAKIRVGQCKVGRFYIVKGWSKLFFCLRVWPDDDSAEFQEVGSDFRMTVLDEKVKPVQVFMFSK